MTNHPIQSQRLLISSLLSSISSSLPSISSTSPSDGSSSIQPSNPLSNLSPISSSQFLTLHVLFPNEFLPALDLLDRRLVTQYVTTSTSTSTSEQGHGHRQGEGDESQIYFVRSSQVPKSRFQDSLAVNYYEVRTGSWNCTCPAFIFSVFPSSSTSTSSIFQNADGEVKTAGIGMGKGNGKVGGVSRGDGVPICKHLLACVLVEGIDGFRGYVEGKGVSEEEMAGWCAGWGDK